MKFFEDDFFNTTCLAFTSDKVVGRETIKADVALNYAEALIAQLQNKQISHIYTSGYLSFHMFELMGIEKR